MGVFTDRMVCNVEDHVIEAEARSTLLGFEYSLIVDNERVDTCKGLLGTMTLRGFLNDEPIIVTIKQGLLGTKFLLHIGQQEYKFQRIQ